MVTGFDLFLKEKGFDLVEGELKDLNTYNNSWRTWIKDNILIRIGLYALPTRIGVCNFKGVNQLPIPVEKDYEEYLLKLS